MKSQEEEVAEESGVTIALVVSSGTPALITALSAAGIGPGWTLIVSMSAVVFCDAVPVFAEVDESPALDPGDVERKITEHSRANPPFT